jgi:MFS family permease
LGYFGIANNLAMSIGPMISLFLHDYSSYQMIFFTSIASSLIGFVVVSTVKAKKTTIPTIKKDKEAIVLDRFFLIKGTHAGICLTLMGIPYGMLTTYIAIYGKEIGMYSGMGIFFTLMAIGLIFSRFFAGRMVDRGHLLKVITVGTIICTVSIFVLPALKDLFLIQQNFSMILFYVVAVFLGLGYGMLFPAYNTLFVNLAPHNRRATASSTFLTTWDVGIGLGLIIGGKLGDTHNGLSLSFLTGGLIAFSSLVYFIKITAPHYKKNTIIT